MSRRFAGFVLLAAALACLACCGHGGTQGGGKGGKGLDTLLLRRDTMARELIDSGMSHARDSMTYFEYRARLARYYYLSTTPDSLVPVLDGVDQFAARHGDEERGRHLLAYSCNIRAAYYHAFHKNPDAQIDLYGRAYRLLMQSNGKDGVHEVAANLADAYASKNELPKAAEWYRRALFLVDSLRLPEKENATLYMGLASIYQQLGDNDNALGYFRKTERMANEMSVGMQAYFLNNFGSYYYYTGNYHEALKKFQAMKRLLYKYGMQDNFDMYLCKLNLADVYLNLDSLRRSAQCLDVVEPYMEKNGDAVAQYYCRTIRIGIAVKEHRWAEVRRLAADDGDAVVSFQLRQIRSRYMREYYEATGDFATAYRDLRDDVAYSDSLEHNRSNMRTADIMARFTADTLRLHSDLELQRQKESVRKIETVTVFAVASAAILVLLLLFLVQRSRKQIAETRMKVLDLRLQGARIRISPHFVFNILNNHILTAKQKKQDTELIELSRLIRENLDMSRRVAVPLAEELDFVRQYVKMEQPLVGDDFDFKIQVAPEIDEGGMMVPSMMVQILVENAFVHALSGWDGHKMLHIDVTHQGNTLTVDVTDNGPGFGPGNLARGLSAHGNGLHIIRQTIAVLNSRSRRKILFNVRNVVEGGKTVGCKATIAIPDGVLGKE